MNHFWGKQCRRHSFCALLCCCITTTSTDCHRIIRQGLNSESDNPLNLKPMYSLSSQACIRPIEVYFPALSLVLGERQEKSKEAPVSPWYPMEKKESKSTSSEIPFFCLCAEDNWNSRVGTKSISIRSALSKLMNRESYGTFSIIIIQAGWFYYDYLL